MRGLARGFFVQQGKKPPQSWRIARVFNEVWTENTPPRRVRGDFKQALMERGHGLAARLGYDYAVVLGHPAYYPKAGCLPAEDFGIRAPFPTEEGSFLVRPLRADAPPPCGVITYDPAFGI